MTDEQWFVIPVNPYPWKVPPFSAARAGKKLFVKAGRDEGLHSYKMAIKEFINSRPHEIVVGPVEMDCWFYRNIPTYTSHQGRTARKHEADTTNLQKATEDALQGLIYDNDKDVVKIMSWRVEQSPTAKSFIVIRVAEFVNMYPIFPDDVQFEIGNMLAHKPYISPPFVEGPEEEIPF